MRNNSRWNLLALLILVAGLAPSLDAARSKKATPLEPAEGEDSLRRAFGPSVPRHRPVPRRAFHRGDGRARPAADLLLRRHRRRRLEDDRRRLQLGADVRQGLQDGLASARSPYPNPIRTSCTSAWASRRSAATSPTATASTSRPTRARPGRTWDSRTRTRSRASSSIRAIRTSCTWRRSATSGGRIPSAGSTAPKTAARRGRKSSSSTTRREPPIFRWIRTIRACFTPRSGRRYRKPWTLEDGGPGSSLYKSTDGGDTWKKLTEGGLPAGPWGRVGVAASPARAGRVFAMIEAEKDKGGLYRSDDWGDKWTHVSDSHGIRQRAWYYSWIFPDTKNADIVYQTNVEFHKSSDGGKTFHTMPVPHGDNHILWIDPDDSNRMILGNDGGATITFNGGQTWSTQDNQPTAQFYRVITDDRFPYWVYGAQQDNSTVGMPTGVPGYGGITANDWYDVGGGESAWIAPDPAKPGDRVRRGLRRPDHAFRPEDAPVPRDRPVAAARFRARDERPQVPVPVERADHHFQTRSEGPLLRFADPDALDRRGPDVGRGEPGPHAQRSREAGLRGRVDRPRHHRRRGLRHDLLRRGIRRSSPASCGREATTASST